MDVGPIDLHDELWGAPMWSNLFVTILKEGSLTELELFALRGAIPDSAYDEVIDQVIGYPGIVSKPFAYVRHESDDIDVFVQFIDVTNGLETTIMHEDYDDAGDVISILPDYLIVSAQIDTHTEDSLLELLHLEGSKYVRLHDSGNVTYNVLLDGITD